jgi:hypothetical protein
MKRCVAYFDAGSCCPRTRVGQILPFTTIPGHLLLA